MAQPVIQTAFHTGELAPSLYARVDLAKYHTAAALMRNFFVDYRGGASSRMGTKYVLQAFKSSTKVRLIGFQASFTVAYVLEFGDQYIRFYNNGAPVLEATAAITGATQANPCVLSVVNTYSVGDWVFAAGVLGMTQLNGKYYKISARTGGTITLSDLNGVAIDSSAYTAYASGGTVARVYTIVSPYAAADLALVKFTQNVNTMIFCHPNYAPYILTITNPTSWTMSPIVFGATISAPAAISTATTLAAGNVNYSYVATGVDANGQESGPSPLGAILTVQNLLSTPGTNTITYSLPTGGVAFNVYKAQYAIGTGIPSGSAYGYIGTATGNTFNDVGAAPDFSQTPPIAKNPFSGSGVTSINLTAGGTYTTQPVITIAPPGGAGITATAQPVLQAFSVTAFDAGVFYAVGDTITLANGIILQVTAVGAVGRVTGFIVLSYGGTTPLIPNNPVEQTFSSGAGSLAQFTILWTVVATILITPGTGYGAPPTVFFTPAGAGAVAVIGASSAGNPSVPAFFQQRLVLASPPGALQTFYMSQPGSYYNYNITDPVQADDAITSSIISSQLNAIKAMIPMPSGLIMLTSSSAWQVNGGSAGAPVTPASISANANAYNGASDVPPIVCNFDILYVQSKGSIVRDLSYNFYANVFTGTDITVLSSHLFFSFQINEWAWAEEPFKLVWAVRNDGTLLSLTYLKEQELIGWAHHDTNGVFQSIATVTETISTGAVDAIYVVVQRTVNGNVVQYIERMADRYFNTYFTPWCVDAGLQYNSTPATVFSGLDHLVGMTVTGLADGKVIAPQVVSATGSITLPVAASIVTVGLAFTPQLQTLPIDTGDPTIQGKVKSIPSVTVRCADTLGLSIGHDFTSLTPMKDLVLGNVGSQTNQVVTGLVTGDARTILGPQYDTPGQYCIQQSNPYPASILGVIPELVVGDTPK